MIDWNEIDLKGKTNGTLKTLCPDCSHTRKKKTDPCLSVNLDKGVAKCWNCDDISIRDYIEPKQKEYTLPPQEWRNYTHLSDNLVKWFKDKRGISQKTLIACKITEESKFHPAKGKEANSVVFNYFEGSRLVNKKYRTGDKCFTQEKNAKKVFYGINDVLDSDVAIIVEGEMDKLAMWEAGYENCISVPNGASDLNDIFENCESQLRNIQTFIIAVDMDEPGRSLEKQLIKRLGKHKCSRVEWSGKDANDELLNGNIDKRLEEAKPYPVDGTFTANDVKSEILDLYDNGLEAPLKPKGQEWRHFNKEFSTLRGQLTTVTGIPTHGKSNFIEWYLISLINDNDLKSSFFSPEHFPMSLHHSVLAEKVIGKPFHNEVKGIGRITKNDLQDYSDWSSKRMFFTAPETGQMPTWDWLIERFKEQLFRFGIDIFVVDAFNKVKRSNPDSLGEINEILARLTLFCQQHDVAMFLIAHPTKMKKDERTNKYAVPTLYDVKGTGDFYDQSHNGLTIYRDFENDTTSAIPTKLKFKHQGNVGKECVFRYCKTNGRYFPLGDKESHESILVNEKQISISQRSWDYDEDEDLTPPF